MAQGKRTHGVRRKQVKFDRRHKLDWMDEYIDEAYAMEFEIHANETFGFTSHAGMHHDGVYHSMDALNLAESTTLATQEQTEWVHIPISNGMKGYQKSATGDSRIRRMVEAQTLADFITNAFDEKVWVDVPLTQAMKDCKKEIKGNENWVIL
eukprot:GEMP01043443.1.p1 GENE.GEMP01043443.1~~GEMP01043443.1.p1  ORF type:complete len:170 (+),score=20.54 GEMP01043443.1:57-512(+)